MTTAVDDFLLHNPSFTAINRKKNRFCGNIEVKDNYYRFEFFAPNFPSPSGISCKLLKGITEVPLTDFKSKDAANFTDYIQELCAFLLSKDLVQSEKITERSVCIFLDELKSLRSGRPCTVAINKSCDRIKITQFKGYHGHYLELSVLHNLSVKVIAHSLPDADSSENSLFSATGSLDVVVGQFWRLLEQFEEFYGHLNTIDELCNVVEPAAVTTKHNWRVFYMTDKVFAKIVVDPFAPSAIILNFIGPTYDVEKYRQVYNENVSRWDADLDVYRNLLRIFDLMYFPMRRTVQNDEEPVEEQYCNICYMYMYEEHVPIVSCDNPRCDVVFHVSCLRKWFATLAEERTFLTVTIGNCPHCKEKLSPSFAQLLEL